MSFDIINKLKTSKKVYGAQDEDLRKTSNIMPQNNYFHMIENVNYYNTIKLNTCKQEKLFDKLPRRFYISVRETTDYSSLDPSTLTELLAIQRKFDSPSSHDAAYQLNFYHNVYYLICNRQIKDIELLIQHSDHTETIIQLTQTNGLIKLTPSDNVKDIFRNKKYLNYGIKNI
jgi:hypothetical protein